jgi:hypothetical protein
MQDTQLLQSARERCGMHGVAVVSVEDQRLAAISTDLLA